MAPIADIARLNKVRFTPQEVADLMLREDQARRRANGDGDIRRAWEHEVELQKLARLLP